MRFDPFGMLGVYDWSQPHPRDAALLAPVTVPPAVVPIDRTRRISHPSQLRQIVRKKLKLLLGHHHIRD